MIAYKAFRFMCVVFAFCFLVGEVARVNEELAIIEHQTRDMASQNYQIFVQSAQTTNLIKKSVIYHLTLHPKLFLN